jgi:hypothetical protein
VRYVVIEQSRNYSKSLVRNPLREIGINSFVRTSGTNIHQVIAAKCDADGNHRRKQQPDNCLPPHETIRSAVLRTGGRVRSRFTARSCKVFPHVKLDSSGQ